ncbi:MAG: RNA polymerase factor sigma-54 [Lachnospiraceae bacterium]|nr:RNA polymerase factor sigma-54 [Lachnospiraceae bacterium]
MDLNIAIKQTQKLVLTPQMEQSLAVLQMGLQELEQQIEEEVLSNPMLTYEETEDREEPERDSEEDESEEGQISIYERQSCKAANTGQFREDYQSYLNSLVDEKSCGTSLKEYLRMQLYTKQISFRRQKIEEYLIECMEESGYLKMTNQEISRILGLSQHETEREIRFLQNLEPRGVFARNIQECLLLQIESMEGETEELRRLVNHYMEEILHNKIPKICKETGWSRKKVLSLTARIKELEPVPGRGYGNGEAGEFIYPDFTVRRTDEGYRVILNRERMKIPQINTEYLPLLDREKSGENYEYLQEQYQNARMLLKNISRREETLCRVAEAIVQRQREFFEKGKMYLSSMNLADIALDIDMHESTVSRALKDKYLECRWGIFELKYFFSNKGTEKNARSCIEKIVQKEDKTKPLSDAQIVKELEKMGVDISRRTVVKYREQLQIPNALQRKKYC